MSLSTTGWTWSHGGFPKALKQTQINLGNASLGKHEVLIRVKAAALNPVDVQLMSLPLLAYVPNFILRPNKGTGCDFAGVIEQAGPASSFQVGDEVLGVIFPFPEGTLQEVIRLDTSKSSNVIIPKPRDWSWEQAAALPLVWLTAHTALAKVEQVVKGKEIKVAVLGGSSASGMYIVHQAKQRGWTVVASCSAEKADFVRGMGADETIDYRTTSVSGRLKEMKPDAIVDCVGGTECLGIAKRYVTLVGDKTDRADLGGSGTYLLHPRMMLRTLRGLVGLGESYICIDFLLESSWLEDLPTLPKDKIVIDSTFGFDQVEQAYTRLNSGRTKGKVVISME